MAYDREDFSFREGFTAYSTKTLRAAKSLLAVVEISPLAAISSCPVMASLITERGCRMRSDLIGLSV